jgi:hypothetical protein
MTTTGTIDRPRGIGPFYDPLADDKPWQDPDGTKWNPRTGVSGTTLPRGTLDEIYKGLTTHDSLHMDEATDFIRRADLAGFEPVDGAGFLYVIEFTASVVKVGQTINPRRRLLQHQRDANTFKTLISHFWISPPHLNYADNELELIDRCLQISTRLRREYFHDIGFRWASFTASTLPFHSEAVKA